MPFFPRKITDDHIREIVAESGTTGWGLSSIGTGDGTTRTFNLPHSGVGQLMVVVSGLVQAPSYYSVSAGTGPGGVDQLVFSVGNEPASGASVEAAGTHS